MAVPARSSGRYELRERFRIGSEERLPVLSKRTQPHCPVCRQAIGAVLGSGILVLPATTAQKAGAAVAWNVMSALAFPLSLTLGRLDRLGNGRASR
jgi:hypothetical protein